jgi:hypothetical protein
MHGKSRLCLRQVVARFALAMLPTASLPGPEASLFGNSARRSGNGTLKDIFVAGNFGGSYTKDRGGET